MGKIWSMGSIGHPAARKTLEVGTGWKLEGIAGIASAFRMSAVF